MEYRSVAGMKTSLTTASNWKECMRKCEKEELCHAWTLFVDSRRNNCELKQTYLGIAGTVANRNAISGTNKRIPTLN